MDLELLLPLMLLLILSKLVLELHFLKLMDHQELEIKNSQHGIKLFIPTFLSQESLMEEIQLFTYHLKIWDSDIFKLKYSIKDL